MKKILILSTSQDPSTNDVLLHLNDLKAPWIRLNFDYLGDELFCSRRIGLGPGPVRLEVLSHQQRCTIDEIGVVWNRRSIQPPDLSDLLNYHEKQFIRREISRFWQGNYAAISDISWINDWRAAMVSKPEQLEAALLQGLKVPPTLISNDPAAIRDFLREYGPEVIVKPVSHAVVGNLHDFSTRPDLGLPHENPNVCMTQKLRLESLDDDRAFSACPAIYQPYVEKHLEIRATIVGDRIFPAAIHVNEIQGNADQRVDWRRLGTDLINLPHTVHPLPAALEQQLLGLMKSLNLVFGCVDLILTPGGEYVFLEVNPNGQWGWIEVVTGLPITRAVAELLAAHVE